LKEKDFNNGVTDATGQEGVEG